MIFHQTQFHDEAIRAPSFGKPCQRLCSGRSTYTICRCQPCHVSARSQRMIGDHRSWSGSCILAQLQNDAWLEPANQDLGHLTPNLHTSPSVQLLFISFILKNVGNPSTRELWSPLPRSNHGTTDRRCVSRRVTTNCLKQLCGNPVGATGFAWIQFVDSLQKIIELDLALPVDSSVIV